jgi:inosose dehydratase
VFAIVEHDLYPCPPDVPLPIAQRTHRYIGSCGFPSLELGRPKNSPEAQA